MTLTKVSDSVLKDSDTDLLIAQETNNGRVDEIKHYRADLRHLGEHIDQDPTIIVFPTNI